MTLEESILATLAYHDIFNYPLTQEEIRKYLIEKKATFASVKNGIDQLIRARKVGSLSEYLFLKGRKKTVILRKKRQKYSNAKFKKALFFSKILKAVPTLKMVAVSGALAMENSHKKDDIDLVLISAKNTLWTTRFIVNLLLWPFRRDPSGKKIANRACLNLFIDESNLKIQPSNLYHAHEICQMKPLWDRDRTYQKFISANSWVKNFLPNWQADVERLTTNDKRKIGAKALVFQRLALVVENLLKNFQLWYMRSKITTERIGDTQLFFHPANTMEAVLETYRKNLRRLKLL